jgi:hypothetical protein
LTIYLLLLPLLVACRPNEYQLHQQTAPPTGPVTTTVTQTDDPTVGDDPTFGSDTASVSDTSDSGAGSVGNAPPSATDDVYTALPGQVRVFDVLTNDSDDGTLEPASLEVIDLPEQGTATVEPDGTILYHSDTIDELGDSLTYRVSDDEGLESNVATVAVELGSPYEVGHHEFLPAASVVDRDLLIGNRFAVAESVMLERLAVVMASSGENIRLAIYDDLPGVGEPGNLVAASEPTLVTTNGRLELPVTEPTLLTPGDYYLFMNMDVGMQVRIALVSDADPAGHTWYRELDFDAPLPASFGPTLFYTGQQFNSYLLVY